MLKNPNHEHCQLTRDIAAYENAAEGIRQGLEDSMNNLVRPVNEFFAEFEVKHCIVDAVP